MDITNELKFLIESNIKPGEYMFSDSFNLEDTLPAIDIGNSKMDRGMIKIQDESLLDFVDSYFNTLSEKNIDVSELLRDLFRLEMTWYTGKAFFNDTLLTCILLHRHPSVLSVENKLISLVIEATMTVASLISYLISSSPVIRDEDFHANLYGMNWWTSTYAGSHFSRFTPSSSSSPTSGEIKLQILLDELESVCKNTKEKDTFYFARLYCWINFLNEFIKTTSITSNSSSINSLISGLLESSIGECEDDSIMNDSDTTIFPELANLFGLGCVRPHRQILSLNQSIKIWNRSLKDDLNGFIGFILINRPRCFDLMRLLSERSRDPLKPPILPIFRSILYFSIVQNRFESFFQTDPRDQYISSSLPSSISLAKLPDLPLLLQDFVQVYSCTSARQRRFLPDLIEFWDERILKKDDLNQSAGSRSICWLKHLRDILSIDLIFLYGQLKLLSDPIEQVQAAQLINLFFDKFESQGKFMKTTLNLNHSASRVPLLIDDPIRWKHRWGLIARSLQNDQFQERNVPEIIISWYRTMIKFGKTAFSFPEPDWLEDQFGTPFSSQVGNVFTMYTTDPIDPIDDYVSSNSSDNSID